MPEAKKFLRVVLDGEGVVRAEFLPARDLSLPRLLLTEEEIRHEIGGGPPWDYPGSQERVALAAIDALWRRLAREGDARAKARTDAKASAKTEARAERGAA